MKDSVSYRSALDDHVLKVELANGSIAFVNMAKRMKAIRLRELNDAALFRSVRLEGDCAVWDAPHGEIRVSIRELLETML